MSFLNSRIRARPNVGSEVDSPFRTKRAVARPFGAILICCFLHTTVYAGDWRTIPSLSLSTTYSDNINQDPSGFEQSAFVVQSNPGVSIRGVGGRTNLNLNYRMQNIFNQGGNGGVSINNQLQADGSAQLIRNQLFLNVNSTISQQNTNNTGRRPVDNLSDGRRSNVVTFGVNTNWRPNLKGYANADVGLGYNTVLLSSGQASNSGTFTANVNARSGYRLSNFNWSFGFNNSTSIRDSGDNVTFRNYTASIGYRFNRKFNMFMSGGCSENDFESNTDSSNNGCFYSPLGITWTPSYKYRMQASVGFNLQSIDITLNPSARTQLAVGYDHRDVGTNTGSNWNVLFRHLMPRSVWEARYFVDTTTTQQVLQDLQVFDTVDAFGNPIDDPVTSQPFQRSLGLPSFTNQVFTRNRAELSFTGQTAKSTFNVVGFWEKRNFQETLNQEKSIGLDTSWNWNWGFATRTRSLVRAFWSRNTDSQSIDGQDDLWGASLSISRNMAVPYTEWLRSINTSVEYRFLKQSSDLALDNYQENRVTANINVLF